MNEEYNDVNKYKLILFQQVRAGMTGSDLSDDTINLIAYKTVNAILDKVDYKKIYEKYKSSELNDSETIRI